MKFKAIALAVGLTLGSAGAANAQIAANDLFFTAIDAGSNLSFTLDLNRTLASFVTNTGFSPVSVSLTGLSVWNSFLSQVNALSGTTANIRWLIGGTQLNSNFLAGYYQNPPLPNNYLPTGSNSSAMSGGTQIGGIINRANSIGNSDSGVISTVFTNSAAPIVTDTCRFGQRMPFAACANLANSTDPLNLYRFNVGAAPTASFAGNATLDGTGTLTVTAVPEPGTYALMLAGLFAIGAIARRRLGK